MARHRRTPLAVTTPTSTPNPYLQTPLDRPGITPDPSSHAGTLGEWDLILKTRSNALLQGPLVALEAVVPALKASLPSPHYTTSALRWSLPTTATATLFLEHVTLCSAEQQLALMNWLDAVAPSVQVITTTQRRLFRLVESGAFLEALYYRLNTIHLVLGPTS